MVLVCGDSILTHDESVQWHKQVQSSKKKGSDEILNFFFRFLNLKFSNFSDLKNMVRLCMLNLDEEYCLATVFNNDYFWN